MVELSKDKVGFKDMLAEADQPEVKRIEKVLGDSTSDVKRSAVTKLEWNILSNLYDQDDVSKAQESIKQAENKFNKYRKLPREKSLHQAVLDQRNLIMEKKPPKAKS